MNDDIPMLESEPLTPEEERLLAFFDELEIGQLEFLDQAAKRIIELCSAMLGIVFVVIALGDQFPPAYPAGSADLVKALLLGTLALFVLALLAGLRAVQPRRYWRSLKLAELQSELERMIAFKRRWFRWATVVFGLGCLALAVLMALIVLAV